MISMIIYKDAAYPIAHIDHMSLEYDIIVVGLAGSSGPRDVYLGKFPSEDDAKAFYNDCLQKIEAYYTAMMPCKADKNQDADKEIEAIQADANRAYAMTSRLAAYIKKLCALTMGDKEIPPMHLDDNMKCLERWVMNKAKGE